MVIEVNSGKCVKELQPHRSGVSFPKFSADGKWLAFCLPDSGIEIWDIAQAKCFRTYPHLSTLFDRAGFAFAPHAQIIAWSDHDHSVVLIETRTGQQIYRLPGHEARVNSLMFAHDGMRLITGSEDRTALVWSLAKLGDKIRCNDDQVWRALASDAKEAYPVLWALTVDPKRALVIASSYLRPDPRVDAKELEQLVKDLESSSYVRRVKAMDRLRGLGPQAELVIRDGLARTTDPEVNRRLQSLEDDFPRPTLSRDELRDLRLMQALEAIGTRDSARVLTHIANGPPGPRNFAARTALARLKQRSAF
jgi:hypothetical protein